jgi:cell division protein FtsB
MMKVQGHPDLFRDEETKAIINTSSEYDKYIQNRKQRSKQTQEFDDLKDDVTELKQMMAQLLQKLNGNG